MIFSPVTAQSFGFTSEMVVRTTHIEVRERKGCGGSLAWMERYEVSSLETKGRDMFAGLLSHDNSRSTHAISS